MKWYQLDALRRSRYILDKKLPRLITIFVFCLVLVIGIGVYYAMTLKRNDVVKVSGMIVLDKPVYLASNTTGITDVIHFNEGEWVDEGSVVLSIRTSTPSYQDKVLEVQKNDALKQMEILERYIGALDSNENTMSKELEELEYYEKIEYYFEIMRNEYQQNQTIQNKIESLRLNTKEETRETVQVEIESLENQLEGLSQSYQVYTQLVSEASQKYVSLQSTLTTLNAQLDVFTREKENSHILATHSGKIHFLTNLEVGVGIQATQVFAELVNDDSKHAEVMIPLEKRHKVQLNQKVTLFYDGFNLKDDKRIEGTIVSIEEGIINQETEKGIQAFYRAQISVPFPENLKENTPFEAHIIYAQKTYWDFIVDKLNFN